MSEVFMCEKGQLTCPFCGHDKAYFLNPANGRSRATGKKKTMSVHVATRTQVTSPRTGGYKADPPKKGPSR